MARSVRHCARYANCSRGDKPDVLIVVCDDQNENFTEFNQPQFAIYVGDELVGGPMNEPGKRRALHRRLAEAILTGCVEADIDLSYNGQAAGYDRKLGSAKTSSSATRYFVKR
jgi:hypothetical protein